MTKSQILLLFLLVCVGSLLLSSTPDDVTPRLINDHFDLENYRDRGSWIIGWREPYADVFSEYPQLATYMFAIPHMLGEAFNLGPDSYRYFFSILMAVCLAITTVLVYQERSDRKYLALLMFLPASIYFTHNRYDIVPAMFTLLSIVTLVKGRFQLAAFLLAISVTFKWYPVVLFPIYLSHFYTNHKRINWRMIGVFAATIGLAILPTLLISGIDGFLVPYRFHLERGVNRESIVFLFVILLTAGGIFDQLIKTILYNGFLLLQISVSAISLFGEIKNKSTILAWTSAAILSFMLFAKYYSPQWLLWILPFLILRAKSRRDIVLIILFDLFTYLKFPLAFDMADQSKFGSFDVLIVINVLLLFYFLYRSLAEIASTEGFGKRIRSVFVSR
jgi:hypothetical protein